MSNAPGTNTIEAASPGINAAVSASAGTGKTWLLVARLLRLLLAGETPASILAISFTRKAAAEIRERLTAKLRHWTRVPDDELRSDLDEIGAPPTQAARARSLYETLVYAENDIRILTFHSFCAEILTRFPFEARVPPGFEICGEEWELRDEALNQLYAAAGTGENTGRALRTLFETCGGLHNTSAALRDFLAHRNDWLAYAGEDGDPVQTAVRRLGERLGVAPEDAEHDPVLDEHTRGLLEAHARWISRHGIDTNLKHAATIHGFLEAGAPVSPEMMQTLHECFFTNGKARDFTSKPLQRAIGPEFDEFTDCVNTLSDTLQALRDTLLKRQTFRRNRAWYTAGQHLGKIYRELKLARRQLDFDDIEWLAYRLVNRENDAHWIQYRLNERIHHVLVDEFQDTNPQQWQLLRPLLEEMASHENTGSAFIVGDVKQSIYGFRRADPRLQGEAEHWLQRRMDGRLYTADTSRRSSPAIIEFVNRVFDPEAGDRSAGPQDGYAPSLPGFRTHDSYLDTPGDVVVLPFASRQKPKIKPREWRHVLRDPPAPDVDKPAFEEGKRIAACITGMVNDRVAVHDRDGRARPLRFGDVCLLLRRRTNLGHYERAFTEAKLPHASGRAGKMFDSHEIADVLALLKFLVNPARNLDLAQVLRSPIFSATDEQLIALARTGSGSWFARLGQLRDDAALQRAHELLCGWVEAARTRLPAHDLLDRVYHEADLVRRYRLAARDGEADEIEKNLVDLLDHSLEFESGRYPDIAHYARSLKRRIARAEHLHLTSPGAEDPERMRILTIHQAKGLEAPVIVLADCGAHKNHKDTYSALVDWLPGDDRPANFLLIPKKNAMDSFTETCKRRLDEREAREDVNLLYVALTRARQYLVISGSEKEPGSWYALLARHARETTGEFEKANGEDWQRAAAETAVPATAAEPGPLPPASVPEISPNTLVGAAPETGGRRAGDGSGELRGQVIHYALKLLSEGVGENTLRNTLNARFPRASGQLRDWVARARALINDESLRELFDDSRYEEVLNEAPVSFTHEAQQYYGVIDRMCVGAEEVWLVDYKTHRSPDEAIETLKSRYEGQMRAYHAGVAKLWPKRAVRVSLLLTESARLCDYDFDRE